MIRFLLHSAKKTRDKRIDKCKTYKITAKTTTEKGERMEKK